MKYIQVKVTITQCDFRGVRDKLLLFLWSSMQEGGQCCKVRHVLSADGRLRTLMNKESLWQRSESVKNVGINSLYGFVKTIQVK